MIDKIITTLLKFSFGKKLFNYARKSSTESENYNNFCQTIKKSISILMIMSFFFIVIVLFSEQSFAALIFLFICCIGMSLLPFLKNKKEFEKDQRELNLGIENLTQEISILISSGMSLNNALRIKRSGRNTFRIMIQLYEEIEKSEKKGQKINYAIMSFNAIYKNKYLNKLNIIISQSKKKGGSKQEESLRNLSDEILLDRKMKVRKKAETLSSKMLMPLMVSMIGIIVMIMVPIIMQFNY